METMTAFELCGIYDDQLFTIGNSKIVWESISYRGSCDKCYISRLCDNKQGGKPAFMGLNYKSRYISPDTIIKIK